MASTRPVAQTGPTPLQIKLSGDLAECLVSMTDNRPRMVLSAAAGIGDIDRWRSFRASVGEIGAGSRARTDGLDLGKVALYQLSYTRDEEALLCRNGTETQLQPAAMRRCSRQLCLRSESTP